MAHVVTVLLMKLASIDRVLKASCCPWIRASIDRVLKARRRARQPVLIGF